MGNRVFQNVSGLMPGRSVFDLSYEKKLTCDMGQLIPIMCDEMVPGDKFDVKQALVIRFQPLVAPILHEINAYIHLFFVPYRILDENWEPFITGGVDGDDETVLPRWNPTPTTGNAKGTLWDYLGFPTDVVPVDALPMDYPRRAYNMIYNEYYRDETLMDLAAETNEAILYRSWEKDYFTSALQWQQRGTAPSLPISGMTTAVFAGLGNQDLSLYDSTYNFTNPLLLSAGSPDSTLHTSDSHSIGAGDVPKARLTGAGLAGELNGKNTVDLSEATTFNVADLRLAFQIQKWMERNARAGVRYTEFLRAHFGVAPRDDRLQRPEYIGGMKSPVVISEVLQTSSTDGTSAQGNQAGHGIVAESGYVGSYHAVEFGLIMGIMSIMPRSAYQQGINRQWLRRTKYDFYSPEFANLSEQAIERAEIYASGSNNRTIFGYQGRYDEMRVKQSMVCADMRDTFDYWHLGRQFGSAPTLTDSFLWCVPRKDIFAAPSEPGLIVNVWNGIKAIRPLPVASNPGLLDHH